MDPVGSLGLQRWTSPGPYWNEMEYLALKVSQQQ